LDLKEFIRNYETDMSQKNSLYSNREKKSSKVRHDNIQAAISIANTIGTSLGPRGMDKMILQKNGKIIISNDGATILSTMEITHPASKILIELAKSQDVTVGDGTTTVTVICGSLLKKCLRLFDKNIHPSSISTAIYSAFRGAVQFLEKTIGIPINLQDHESLIMTATTSLSSKVVSQYSSLLSPLAVKCILKVSDTTNTYTTDLKNIKSIKILGGTVDEIALCKSLHFVLFAEHPLPLKMFSDLKLSHQQAPIHPQFLRVF
jgi:T-complex protein 1 subunit delta